MGIRSLCPGEILISSNLQLVPSLMIQRCWIHSKLAISALAVDPPGMVAKVVRPVDGRVLTASTSWSPRNLVCRLVLRLGPASLSKVRTVVGPRVTFLLGPSTGAGLEGNGGGTLTTTRSGLSTCGVSSGRSAGVPCGFARLPCIP